MKGKRIGLKRIMAFLAAFILLITEMPAISARAEGNNVTYTFDAASDSIVNTLEKSAAITAGKCGTDNYFEFSANSKRSNSSTYSAELPSAKNAVGYFAFTVTGSADATFEVSSTGSSNTSECKLVDSHNEAVIADGETSGVIAVSTTSKTTITYSNLTSGTYKLVVANEERGLRLYTAKVVETPAVTDTFRFVAADETAITGIDKKAAVAAGKYGTDNYFEFSGTVTRANSDVFSAEIGKAQTGAFEFTVLGSANVTFSVSSTGKDNSSDVLLLDSGNNRIVPDSATSAVTVVTTASQTTITYSNLAAGKYMLVAPSDGANKTRGFRIYEATSVDTHVATGNKPARAAWSEAVAPVITAAAQNGSNITVSVDAVITEEAEGGDKLDVEMYDSQGKKVDTKTSTDKATAHTLTFTPDASGTYTFKAFLSRYSETDSKASDSKSAGFVLPLSKPAITGVTNIGNRSVDVDFGEVKEATSYEVSVQGTSISTTVTTNKATLDLSSLLTGNEYSFLVTAVRGGDRVTSDAFTKMLENEAEVKWLFSAFGSGVSTSKNGYNVNADGSVTVYSEGGKGKLVPNSTDGLAFYYTPVPTSQNFTLSAKVKVDSWTFSNGQEGFGLMAADRVGVNGDSTAFWNNSYMASVTKVEYFWDAAEGEVSNSGTKISQKLGIGSQEKKGVTTGNLSLLDAGDTATINSDFSSTMYPLDVSTAALGAGTYNVVGNATASVDGTVSNPVTEFVFTIQKNNTGYFVSYTDASGNTVTKKYYDTDALSKLDTSYVYAGFFASRNARITVSDISFTTIDPADDAPKEQQGDVYIEPVYSVLSAGNSNSEAYILQFNANADGVLRIVDNNGVVVADGVQVTANVKKYFETVLKGERTTYTVTFTPNADYKVDEHTFLKSYEPKTFNHVVTFKGIEGEQNYIFVAPDGLASNNGTIMAPVDIYTAVKFARPGQTIVLRGGTYNLSSTVTVERGVDGTSDKPIYMVAYDKDSNRPVFDFGGRCAGFVMGGDYWYCKGFDVTNSANGQKGLQISGSYSTYDDICAYHNGNTGIQLSRLYSTDTREEWPHNDYIVNCTSYGNADAGYEDADGFAAKLTVGDGIVFDGCVAYCNADDGWDLYAKVETGSIGAVTIRNCVAYRNGFLEDGTNAGNGNGFKMGGDSLPGGHILINSYAFDNKAKGIDSNSCPDIKVYNSISYNNGSYNIALYTNNAGNTDYTAENVISFRTEGTTIGENIKPKGTQDNSKIYGTSNYYWDNTNGYSANSEGDIVSADWFESLTFTGVFRNSDNSINMNGFLKLCGNAAVPAGFENVPSSNGFTIPVREKTSADEYNEKLLEFSATLDEVLNAAEPVTVVYNDGPSLPNFVVDKIMTNPNITVVMDVEYEGEKFHFELTKELLASIYKPDVLWYGPRYLVTAKIEPVYHTIARDETLNIVCGLYGITLDNLLALNPEITNPNVVYAGQQVRIK